MFGFNLWQIAFAVIAFPVLSTIGVFQLRQFELRSFQPRVIEQRQLSAARDLRGTWQGTMNYTLHQPDFYSTASGTWRSGNCAYNYLLQLVVNSQTDTTITGTDSYSRQGPSNICDAQGASLNSEWSAAAPFRADISGSRITSFNFSFSNVLGPLTGSFTSDTITINVGELYRPGGNPNQAWQLDAPINLLRK